MSRWTLSRGLELPDPHVPIYLDRAALESGGLGVQRLPKSEAPPEVRDAAWDTYKRAHNNAADLVEDAHVLRESGRHARAFALACTALEEIGKSQFAADVYTGFSPPDEFLKLIRDHRFKSAYTTRAVVFSSLPEPNLHLDANTAEELFQLRNDALYASPDNEVANANFEDDATTMIEYCEIWLDTIVQMQIMAERIGTKAFLK
jgi:AbiV family abortive infection protein